MRAILNISTRLKDASLFGYVLGVNLRYASDVITLYIH
jgi:hypothetical protein